MQEDAFGNTWFVQGKNLAVADYSGKPTIINIPELNNQVLSGFENIYPIDTNNVFVGSENGFYHINYAKYKQNIRLLTVYIRKVEVTSVRDSILYGGFTANNKLTNSDALSLSHTFNSLHLEYYSPVFEEQPNVEYSYFLKGLTSNGQNGQISQKKTILISRQEITNLG